VEDASSRPIKDPFWRILMANEVPTIKDLYLDGTTSYKADVCVTP